MSEREKIELVWDSIAPSLERELKLHTPGKNYNELIVPLSHMCKRKGSWHQAIQRFLQCKQLDNKTVTEFSHRLNTLF